MYIRVYNVGFGDSSAIVSDDYMLLVDCGSIGNKFAPGLHIDNVINDINKQFKAKSAYAVVTHFHNDHCNLLQRLELATLDRLIVPNFFSPTDIEIELRLLQASGGGSAIHSFAYNMLTLIPSLISSGVMRCSGHVHFVSEGSVLSFRESSFANYEVFNPPRKPHSAKIAAIVQGINDSDSNLAALRGEIVDRYGVILSRATERLGIDGRDAGATLVVEVDQLVLLCNELSDLLEEYDSLCRTNLASFQLSSEERSAIKEYQNQISLVLRKRLAHKSILFTGDVNKSRLNEIVKTYDLMKDFFIVIKVPHHGTRGYYPGGLPPAENLIISNRLYKNWCIAEEYPSLPCVENLICTNNNGCKYIKKYGSLCRGGSRGKCGFHPDWCYDILLP